MGISLLECDRFEDAIRAFSDALALDSTNASTYYYQGVAYLQSQRYNEALAALNTSLP